MNKLKEYRKAAGMTQTELAEKAGMCRQTIINLEKGRGKYAHWWTMKQIAEVLGATVEEIFLT